MSVTVCSDARGSSSGAHSSSAQKPDIPVAVASFDVPREKVMSMMMVLMMMMLLPTVMMLIGLLTIATYMYMIIPCKTNT